MQCQQTPVTIPIRSLSTQSTTVSFRQVLRDTNSGKDLDAPGLRFCARYTRGADGGELWSRFKNTCLYKTDGQGNYGHILGNILKMWDILRDILTFWDMLGTSCRTSCGTFSHFGTSWGHLAGHLAGHSHISGHLGTSCGTSCGTFSHFGTSWDILRDILRDIWWGRPGTKDILKTFWKTF